jgi:hypothetical protein
MDTIYLVECFWPGVTREVLMAANERARDSAVARSREGCAVAFVGALLVPADEVVFFQFSAASEHDVTRAARAAELPFDRVSESQWLKAEGAPCD